MITNSAQNSVLLKTLMDNPQTSEALKRALSTYPLYKAKSIVDLIPTREELNKRLLNNYKYREIGFETVGRFLDELEIVMCEIMPYYNERLKTVEIMSNIEDPFGNVDVTETYEEERKDVVSSEGSTTSNQSATSKTTTDTSQSGQSTSNENGTSERTRKASDTPQNNVSNIDNYLTAYEKENGKTTNNVNATSSSVGEEDSETTNTGNTTATSQGETETAGTVKHTLHRKGNQGVNTYAHDMNEFRTTIIDVVNEIINDKRVRELFMLVW